MKWIKLSVFFSSDPFVKSLKRELGDKGKLMLIELWLLMGREINLESPNILRISWEDCQNILETKRKSLERFLEYCQKQGKLEYRNLGRLVEINYHKFKQYTDNFTRRALRDKAIEKYAQSTYQNKGKYEASATEDIEVDIDIDTSLKASSLQARGKRVWFSVKDVLKKLKLGKGEEDG